MRLLEKVQKQLGRCWLVKQIYSKRVSIMLGKIRKSRHKGKILLAEIAALLHDTGKLNSLFIEKHIIGNNYDHGKALDDKGYSFLNQVLDGKDGIGLHLVQKHHGYEEDDKGETVEKCFDELSSMVRTIIVADILSATDDRYGPGLKNQQKKLPPYGADPFGVEREIDLKKIDQKRDELYKILETADKKWKETHDTVLLREEVYDAVYRKFTEGQSIAETTRPANDVGLWDHVFGTAAFFKALWVQQILGFPLCTKPNKKKKPKDIRAGEDCTDHFTLFYIKIFYEKEFERVEKITDLLGRLHRLEQVQKKLKELIELECVLGNEIYIEPGFSCFLLPVQFTKEEFQAELKKKVGGFLKQALLQNRLFLPYKFGFKKTKLIHKDFPAVHREAQKEGKQEELWYIQDLRQIWGKQKAVEICPLCGISPAVTRKGERRSERLCESCRDLRQEGHRARGKGRNGTVWIDEISDPYTGRVAILSIEVPLERWFDEKGMLQLHRYDSYREKQSKTPSYERMRRIWRSIHDFFEEFEKKVQEELGLEQRFSFTLEPTDDIKKNRFYKLLEAPEEVEVYIGSHGNETVTRLRAPNSWQRIKTITLREDTRDRSELKVRIVESKLDRYYPYIKILQNMNHLILCVPARDARKLTTILVELFEKRFPKALGKLPLSVGLLYAHAKTPLSLLLQGVFKMNRYLNAQANMLLSGEVIQEFDDKELLCLNIKKISEKDVELKIDHQLGDKSEDEYYTRLPVEFSRAINKEKDKIELWNKKTYIAKMVKELKKNEIVNVILGAFDFEFLDTAGRRFDLYLDENNKKRVTHTLFGANGPRPYNIYHLKLLEKLEAIILRQKEKSDLTDTRLQNIFTLLSTKLAEWYKTRESYKNQESYQWLAAAVLQKEMDLTVEERAFLEKAVLSGLFFDWVELFYRIEKRKLREV